MDNQGRQEGLYDLLDLVINQLKERIKSGEASHSDFSNALKLLKDNNIEVVVTGDDPLSEVKNLLEGTKFEESHLN